MAYDKYTWQTGEVITQEKLNHMEQGIEDAYELPAVTETDNGKVLGVENGQFGLVDGVEIVDIVQTGTDSTTGNPTFNVSFEKCQQIASDFAQGKTLVRLIVREYGLEAPLNVTAMRISTDSYVGTTCYISGNAIDDLNAGSSGLRVCFAKAEIRASGGTALTTRTKTIS